MCGIVGYVGPRQVLDVLMPGLARLEYRGYDSAGVALNYGDSITVLKQAGTDRRPPETGRPRATR